jgi:RTX calcium-binding nonapeptide repeat (4 copies)/WD40-like Beta Propeller Repeat
VRRIDSHPEARFPRRLAAVAAGVLLVLLSIGGGASAATSSGANGDIAFVRSGNIYLVSTGTVLVSGATDPSWSPDGKTLLFSLGGTLETCVVATTCAAPAPLATTVSGTEPAWSPDGTKIAYVSGGTTIHVVTSTGASTGFTAFTGTDPSWSPTSTSIAFTNGGSIYTCTAASCSATLSSALATGSKPSWSPDGTTIAFQAGSPAQIFTIPAGGGAATQVPTNGGSSADTAPTWSPDGNSIVYADSAAGIQEVTKAGAGWTSPSTRDGNALDLTPAMQTVVPVQVVAPSINGAGSPQTGQQLSTTNGNWNGATGSFGYVWQRCDSSGNACSSIGGATASTYVVVSADVGHTLRSVVTASNAAGTTQSSASVATGVVTVAGSINPPVDTVAPTITLPTGETVPQLGDILFASAGTWSGTFPITFTYQWTMCEPADPLDGPCFGIPGATLSFFTVPASLYGMRIRVRITATNAAGSAALSSASTGIVTATAPSLSVTPPIQGGNTVGQTVSVTTGIWTGSQPITYAYQWDQCDPVGDLTSCTPIPQATTSSYVPVPGDIGFSLRVYITATNAVGSATGFTNHTFPIVDRQHFAPSAAGAPTITGTVGLGLPLSGDIGSFNGDTPIATSFVWQRCDATGAACKTIAGAKKLTYKPTATDFGSTLRILVTATNAYGKLQAPSPVTSPVSPPWPHRRGLHIVGTPGSDYLVGTARDDTIYGGAGNDTIQGNGGYDTIYGGAGNDVIVVTGPGSSHIYAGAGSDTIYAADGFQDYIDCGSGRDRVYADSFDITKNCEVVTTP